MNKFNIKKISNRQKFAMSKDELDIHILQMMIERALIIDDNLSKFREVMFKFSDGIQNNKTKERVENAIYSLDAEILIKAISTSIRYFEEDK